MAKSPTLIVAGLVLVSGLALAGAVAAAGLSESPALTLRLADNDRELKRRSLLQCCWRSLRGQSLIGFYCSPKHLAEGLRRRQVNIVTSGGRKVCQPGFGV